MVYLKSCPKCLGDLTVREDAYGSFINCLQCGYMRDLDVKPATSYARKFSQPDPAWYSGQEQLPKAA